MIGSRWVTAARFGTRQGLAVALAGLTLVAGAADLRGQTPAEPTVTLEQAVQLALQHHPAMAQRLGAVRTSESSERTSWGAFLPSLSLSSGASLNSTQRFDSNTQTTVSGSRDSYSAGLSASMDVFTGGRRGAQLRQARAETDAAEAAVVEQRFGVILQTKETYYAVLRAEETVRVSTARIERAEQGLRAAEQRLAVGSATRSDSLRAQLELTQARQAVLEAENQRRSAAWSLGALIGVQGPVGAEPVALREPGPLDMTDEQLQQIALQASPTVASAEAGETAAQAALRVSRAQYFPSVRASGGYDWSNQVASFGGGDTSWSTRLSLSYPLFNGFNREDANERSEVALSVSRMQLADAQRQALASLQQSIDALRVAEQLIELNEEAVRVAAEDLRVQETRYALGSSTILEQITSQVALVEAELALIGARYDYQLALAQLEALVGRELR